MAVESRFVVIRQGVEVETFMDKKSADEYDKMLDMADSLAEMLSRAPVELTEQATEELSVYFAKHRDDVLVALQAKKAKAEPAVKAVEKKVEAKDIAKSEKKPAKPAAKATKTAKAAKATKAEKAEQEAKLSEAS